MKRNNSVGILTIILCLIALFIPTYIAIGAYIAGPDTDYEKEKNEITLVSVTDIDGKNYTYGTEQKDMLSVFTSILETSTKVSSLSDSIRSTPAYTVKCTSENGESAYRFYFNVNGASYYEDSLGNAYGISEEKSAAFFRTECAVCLFYNTTAPTLKNAFNEQIIPQSMTWSYLDYDKKYASAPVTTTAEEKTYELDGGFTLSFDIQPDFSKVILYSGDSVVYDGTLELLSSSVSVNSNTSYKMVIEAEWYEDSQRDYCGKAKYEFVSDVAAQASFTLGANSVEAGQIAVINANNIKDASLINVTFTPALKYNSNNITPVFYGGDGSYSALIPIPAGCFADNAEKGKTMTYQIDVSYGATNYSLHLNVTDRTSVTTKKGDASNNDITNLRTQDALSAFSALLTDTAAKTSADKLWTADKFFSYYNDGYRFSLAFGRNWQLANGDKYTNEFIQYKMKENSGVIAVNDGVVAAVGENAYLGKYIAIDHGMGLQSWYFHLSSVLVSAGDQVANEQAIAKSGTTGFLENSDIGFAMMFTVNGIPVCPYAQSSGEGLEETGLNMVAFAKENG